MDKISINLLPKEVLVLEKDKSKRDLSLRLSALLLVLFSILTGVIIFLQLNQNQKISEYQQQVESEHQQVSALAIQAGLLDQTKQRIDAINNFSAQTSKQDQAFGQISSLIPAGISIVNLLVDKNGKVDFSGETGSYSDLKTLLDILTDSTKNQNKIAKASLDSLSRNQEGKLRFDTGITLK